jgi:hypothetical protein
MVEVTLPVVDTPAAFVTLAVRVTRPLGPGVNATLSEFAPTMMEPLEMVQEYVAPDWLGTEAA